MSRDTLRPIKPLSEDDCVIRMTCRNPECLVKEIAAAIDGFPASSLNQAPVCPVCRGEIEFSILQTPQDRESGGGLFIPGTHRWPLDGK